MPQMTAEERDAAFAKFVKTSDDVFRLNDAGRDDVSVIPTGAMSLDVALGVGGLPTGRVVELYGPEGSGKTSLALSVIAEAQKLGGNAGFIDAEHALSRDRVQTFGIDESRMAVFQPDYGEQALEKLREMCASNAFAVVVVDSVAALTPKAEIDGSVEDNHVGLQARMLSQGLRMITGVISKSKTMVIFINQLRESMNAYGNPEVTPGGRALKFYSSVRLQVRSPKSARIAVGSDPVGQNCRVEVVKNKVAPPFKKCSFDLYYATGISNAGSVREVCVDLGVITTSGGHHYDGADPDFKLGNGAEKVRDFIASHPQLMASYTERAYLVVSGNPDPGADVRAILAADEAGEILPADQLVGSGAPELAAAA